MLETRLTPEEARELLDVAEQAGDPNGGLRLVAEVERLLASTAKITATLDRIRRDGDLYTTPEFRDDASAIEASHRAVTAQFSKALGHLEGFQLVRQRAEGALASLAHSHGQLRAPRGIHG